MPQFAVLFCSDDSAHEPDKTAATSDEITLCDEHAVELASQATMTAAWAFTPRSMAKAVRAEAVTDGPFVDSRQVVAGVYILEAPDLDAALATAATNPVVRRGGGLEVRPVHSGGPGPAPLLMEATEGRDRLLHPGVLARRQGGQRGGRSPRSCAGLPSEDR